MLLTDGVKKYILGVHITKKHCEGKYVRFGEYIFSSFLCWMLLVASVPVKSHCLYKFRLARALVTSQCLGCENWRRFLCAAPCRYIHYPWCTVPGLYCLHVLYQSPAPVHTTVNIQYTVQLQYSTVQYSTVQYSTVQYSTVQYSTVQYSTVQYSTE